MHIVMKTLVLQINYGGLGDHLFYSHIPRIAKQTGAYDRVLISKNSEYRHSDYRKIIWENNPYIDGFADTAGVSADISEVSDGENILDRIMLKLGMDDGIRFHEPEVYLQPAMIASLKDCIVYDPNYVSFVGRISATKLNQYLTKRGIHFDIRMQLREKNIPAPAVREIDTINSLEEFCSVIISCKAFYCLASGGATLAAALGKPAVVFWGKGQNRMFHHSKLHTYVFIHETFSDLLERKRGDARTLIDKWTKYFE